MKPAFEQKDQEAAAEPAAKRLSLVAPGQATCALSASPKGRALKIGAFLGLLALSCLAAYLGMADGGAWLTGSLPNFWSRIIAQVGQVVLVLNVLALLWRIYLVLTYKPVPECAVGELPSLTVVIPAYNEGRQVADTMFSVAASDYPADKLQIIAVDDGSQDDTWLWMQRANAEMPGRFTLIRQPRNMGKRHALYEGFRQSVGEFLVTIDSDSMIEPPTLRRLVSPMVKDQVVGGVGGNVRVLNMKAGLIPRMMEVAFTFGFDFLRASHSRVNTVMCTPGALSAYRKSAVMPVLDQWLNETWLGKPYRIGEDRYLTNLILRQGYHVLFQSNAMVFTNVPVKYKGLVKMLMRWARSDIRESIDMNGFLFKKFRRSSALGARINLLLSWVDMTVCQVLMVSGMISLLTLPPVVALYTLIGAAVVGLVPMTVYLIRHRSPRALWAIPYSVFYVAALAWIPVYAIVTVHKSGWLTRQIKPQASRRPWLAMARFAPIYATAGIVAVLVGSGASLYTAGNNTPAPLTQVASSDQAGLGFKLASSGSDSSKVQGEAPRWSLSAARSSLDQEAGLINLEGVELVLYQRDGNKMRFHGDRAEYDPSDRSVTLEGNVRGVTTNGMFLTTKSLSYSEADKLVETDDDVVLTGQDFKFKGRGITMDMAKNRTVFKKASSSRVTAVMGQPARAATM